VVTGRDVLIRFTIGPAHKKYFMKDGTMFEKNKEYATILAFDVNIIYDAKRYANENGVKILSHA